MDLGPAPSSKSRTSEPYAIDRRWETTLSGSRAKAVSVVEVFAFVRGWTGMSWSELVATGGGALGFLGGVVLAFAASDELRAHRLAILALQTETAALVEAQADPTSPLYRIAGTDRHIENGVRRNDLLTRIGISLLLFSLALTVGAFFVKDQSSPPASTPKLNCSPAPESKVGSTGDNRAILLCHVA